MKRKHIGNRTLEKIRTLARYLEREHKLKLGRAISISNSKMEKILKGEDEPSKAILSKIATYFCISLSILTDDDKDLPELDKLKLDMDLVSIQRNDVEIEMERLEHKHSLIRSWRYLGYKKRVKLIFSVSIVSIILIAYILFCCYKITSEKIEKLIDYRLGSNEEFIYDKYDKKQVEYYNELQETSKDNNPNAYYVEVKVGTLLEKIKRVDSADSSYETRMELYFKFDKDEFRKMFRHYARNVLADQIINAYYSDNPEEQREKNCDYNKWIDSHMDYFESWVEAHDSEYYPGETPSNVLTDNETMFTIGNGEFVADSFGMLKELEEIQYYDENGNLRTLCYQKAKFNGNFEKSFDSVRYPLDSVQFKMYITPVMDAQYIRYVPDRDVNGNGVRISGFSPFFSIGNGYRLIKENKDIKNFILRINYSSTQNNDPAISYDNTIKTQLEIIVRANRAGISLFLQAFINLFSVVIWIIIAFYSQSHTGEDSIGMLGTGLFGVISSMLVGLSMVSDAGIISIITMINIFTLAVIMIMTYQCIAAKMSSVRKDSVMIAYNSIKLRALFYVLTICTIIMFFVIPCMSYMWTL